MPDTIGVFPVVDEHWCREVLCISPVLAEVGSEEILVVFCFTVV